MITRAGATSWQAPVWGIAALLLGAAGPFGVAPVHSQASVRANLATPSGAPVSFSLVDQHGQAVTDKDFRGSFMLVYFGYTYCPDVCPLGLQHMSHAVEALGPLAERVMPIFITIDPERDTSKVLAAYTAHFHPRLIGLTGTPEQIAAAKHAYGVRGFKLFLPPSFDDEDSQGEGEGEGQGEDDDNARYLMQHSSSTYLVAPDGVLESVFPHGTSSLEMARELQGLIE